MHASKLTVMTIAGAAVAAVALAAPGSIINTTWTGPSGGVWGNALNWSGGAVPNNGADQFQVLINGGSPVNLTSGVQISTLTLGSAGQLTAANATTFALSGGLLSNDGLLVVNSIGNQTDFRLDADTTFSTPLDGAVQFSNTQANRMYGSGGFRLTNDDGHVIRGSLQFGANSMRLSNDGLVVADSSAGMTMDLSDGSGNFNTGVLRADGGTLTLLNSTIDNTGGVIEARNGSNFDLNGAAIVNGVIDAQSGGAVRTVSGASLQNVTLNGGGYTGLNATTTALSGSITANGPLTLNSVGNQTDLRLDTNPFTLTSGSIAFSNTQANRFYGNSGGNTLVISPTGIVHGSVQFGVNQLRLSNDGLVVADSSGNMTMDLTDGAGLNFNTGTLRADGGTLTLLNCTIDNTNGVIEARNGSNFDLNGAAVANGVLHAQSGGLVRTVSSASLQDVTLDGPYVGLNATFTALSGSLIANAPLTINSVGNQTDLRFDTNPFTLVSGEIASSNTQANRFYGLSAAHTLVVDAAGTIHGSMQLGVNQTRLDNDGLIVADSSAGMTIDLVDGPGLNFNTGTLRADGGTLTLLNCTMDNTDGFIEARNASNFDLNGAYVLGGEIGTQSGGQVRTSTSATLDGVTVTGGFHGANATLTALRNVITNNGTINIDSAGNQTDVRVDAGPTTLAGTGQMIFSNTQANRLYCGVSTFRLINDAGHTIRGSFQLGVNQTAVTNDGAILADASSGITIDMADNQDFTNGPTGLLRASGGNIQIQPGPFLNSGAVTIDSSRTISRNGPYNQDGGATTVNGVLSVFNGGVSLIGGSLKGSGSVNSAVSNASGRVEPGDSIGLLTINGPYTQSPFGTFKVEIGGLIPGTEHDVLNVVGTANLGGVIEIAVTDDFVPVIGQEFTVLTSTNRVGQFTTLVAPAGFCVVYQGNNVIVRVQNTCSGDIVRSGTVNIDDLFAVINAWGACPGNCQPHCIADIAPPGGDCEVNVDDLFTVINAWGDCP